ncbi:type II toxin-antitoxin system HicA family toxin [Spirosoma sp. 209]|uniref:type II toxin-antitoxin system HicA family toxin n=1 Tax=Spirosoma sp. 209 TaxID=1955701 RepID=UPI00098CF455|nr:type II toxin-antitoxin system HicA family toxin [Spirosoma sp. 209]
MNLSPRRLIKILEENGFHLKRMGKGSHHIYYNPDTRITIPVPVHGKDMKKGTFLAILKEAGLNPSELD